MESRKKIKPIKRDYWKAEEEILLKRWGDKAQCYQWMHNKSREMYQKKNAYYTIPVIIISTITGTANFAQERFPQEYKQYIIMSIGTLSIIAGIITTIYQFLKISEINEGHRTAMLSWGKFHRNLESELTRHPLDRTKASELIKISKDEYDNLVEISPFIPKKILKEFNNKFKKNNNLTKPEIGNIINSVDIFNMSPDERTNMINDINNNVNIKNNNLIKKEHKELNQIQKFKNSFYNLNRRNPTKEEINKHNNFFNEDNNSSESDNKSLSENSENIENGNINLEIQSNISDKEININMLNNESDV